MKIDNTVTNRVATTTILNILRIFVDSGLIKEIKELVISLWNARDAEGKPLKGDDKKALVKKELADVKNVAFQFAENLSSFLINTTIEMVVLYFKVRGIRV